jgi:hypothetical protein
MITTHQLTLGAIVLALVLMLWTSTKESFTPEEKKCRAMAKKSEWKKYDWQSRKEVTPGVWKCAQGWEDTTCNWGMGKQYEKKQCRRLKSTRTGGATDETKCTSNDQCGTDFVCLTRSGTCGPKYNKTTNTTGYCSRNSHCGEGMVCTVLNKCVDPNNPEIGIISGNWNSAPAAPAGSNSAPAPVTPSWTLPDQAIQNALAKYTGSVYKACNISVKSEDKPTKILQSILEIPGMSGAFVIVAYLNSMKNKADATGHVKNYHIECQAYESDGEYDYRTKGYDIYIWAPGAKGNFAHKDKTGFSFWAMNGGKFNDNWRWGKDRKNVTIDN